jgi:hypothetical protein
MTKYKLVMEDDGYKNTLKFDSDDLSDVIANMEIFLKGCGFIFDGVLDIHTGEVQKNVMHYTYRGTTDREFDDFIKQDDDFFVGVNHDRAE